MIRDKNGDLLMGSGVMGWEWHPLNLPTLPDLGLYFPIFLLGFYSIVLPFAY